MQHLHLARGIVEHLRGGSPVGHQFSIPLFVLLGLGQLLARGSNLALHVRLLTLVHLLRGSELLYLQPYLRGVDEPRLLFGLDKVALLHVECQQGAVLFCKDGGLCSLERPRGVILFPVVSAGSKKR